MKRKILFVEDNPVLRQLYALMLQEQPEWDVTTAAHAEEALAIMRDVRFDIVVSDLRMPGMDGVQFFHEVRAQHPQASRIILSGLSDQKEIAECLGETHQFLAKPFDGKTLKATLKRLCGLDAYLQSEKLRTLATQLDQLPSFPSLYLDIMHELATENPAIENIANIIAQDPAMTAKILQVANSAASGLARRVGSPFDAVQYIGTGMVRALALSAHVFSAFEKSELQDFAIARLWDHALKTARLARQMLRDAGAAPSEVEDAYTAGMLHDIGKLALAANVPEQFQRALALARTAQIPLHQAEEEVFGATHAGVGAYVLGLWGLPASIVEAVAFHHAPSQGNTEQFGPLGAVHIASALEHQLCGDEPASPLTKIETAFLAATGTTQKLAGWQATASGLFAAQGKGEG